MKFIAQSSLPDKIKKSLEYSWKEGAVTQLMIGIFDYYLIPYALFLGATPQQIGFLVAVPNICVSLAQLTAPAIVSKLSSRLRVLIFGIGIQTVTLSLMAFLNIIPAGAGIWVLISLVSFFRIIGSIVGPAWGSLMSDYLPEDLRGRYTGFRSKMMGVAGITGLILWGSILHFSGNVSHAFGFFMIFMIAVILRSVTLYFVSRMTDLPSHWPKETQFTFWMFIKRFRESNFVKFIFYIASITFATQLALPYLNVHLLENLKFSYLEYTAIHIAGMFSAMIGFPVWGHHADVIGNAKVVKFLGYLLPVFPFLWTFASTPLHFMAIEAVSGFFWGGFNLCSVNFIYDAVSAPKRVRCLSYFNLINGISIFAGASLGGYLAENLPPINGYSVITLFIISGVLRYVSYFFLAEQFEEVRLVKDKKITNVRLFFSIVGLRPLTAHAAWMDENEP